MEQHREISLEDDPEQLVENARSNRTTNRRVVYDDDLGKYILRGDFRGNAKSIEGAWLSDKDTAEEMELLIKQNGYKIRGYGEPTAEKAVETAERSRSEAADFSFVERKTKDYLRSEGEKPEVYAAILAEMDKDSSLAEKAYNKVFAYCYAEKVLLREVPDEDLSEMIASVVNDRADELQREVSPEAAKIVTAYRVGDFYELFNEDAHVSSDLLGLTETTRSGKPMTGFPAHALDDYKRKFALQGYHLKIGDEREIENILYAKIVKTTSAKPKAETARGDYGEQLNLFEIKHESDVPPKNYVAGIDVEQALRDELIRHGTAFADGKFRIDKFYKSNGGRSKDFAKILAKEYGIGGHSGEGKIRLVTYDGNGIKMSIGLDNGSTTTLIWNWKKISDRIAKLIDNDEYITQADIDQRIKTAQFNYANFEKDNNLYQQAERILDEYGLLPQSEQENLLTITDARDLERGDKIRIDGAEWTVGTIGDYLISLNNSEGEHRNLYNTLDQKWYEVLNEHGFEFVAAADEHTEENVQPIEQENPTPKLKSIVIDLSPRSEREKVPVQRHDFTITDEYLGEGGQKAKFNANVTAIRTLKGIEAENRLATPEEQNILAQYVGWGGLSQAFDGSNGQWKKEYHQLRELLTDEEYRAAKGSVLNAHYTTPNVIGAIYKGLENLGFTGVNILEPAMEVGNFFGAMPEEMRKNSNLSGVELDSITGRIASQLYQSADIQIAGFEKTEFSDNFFDAAVGNVPFGSYGVSDKRYNRENFLYPRLFSCQNA